MLIQSHSVLIHLFTQQDCFFFVVVVVVGRGARRTHSVNSLRFSVKIHHHSENTKCSRHLDFAVLSSAHHVQYKVHYENNLPCLLTL